MVSLSDVPLNSYVWLIGSLACFMLGYRSFASYQVSRNELSRYLAWFGMLMGTGQALLAIPPFFTLDADILRRAYLAAELFIYGSAVAQAAVLWCLILRSRMPIYGATLSTMAVGAAAWLYAIPRSTLQFGNHDFINYRDPLFSTLVIGIVLMSLFVPVGLYFLRSAARQENAKGILTSLTLGLVYIGVGFFTGGMELLTGQVMTPRSAIFDLAFFIVMFSVLLWPHRASVRVPAVR